MLRLLSLPDIRRERDPAILVNHGFSLVDHLAEDVGSDVVVFQLRLELAHLGLQIMVGGQLILDLLVLTLHLLLLF